MKKSIFMLIMMALPVVAIFAQNAPTAVKADAPVKSEVAVGPKADWNATTVDLGNVDFMVSKDAEFVLTNNGNQPLLITSARASCGCTNLRYSQEPILPGKSTTMAVTFNGSGNGAFRKSITVQTNASENPTILQITGTVIKKAQ